MARLSGIVLAAIAAGLLAGGRFLARCGGFDVARV
jgi:hypothetical protein